MAVPAGSVAGTLAGPGDGRGHLHLLLIRMQRPALIAPDTADVRTVVNMAVTRRVAPKVIEIPLLVRRRIRREFRAGAAPLAELLVAPAVAAIATSFHRRRAMANI